MISPMAVTELLNIMGVADNADFYSCFNEVQGKHSLNCAFSVVSDGFLPDTFQNPPLQYYHFQNRGQLKYTESAQNCCVYISRFAFKRTFCACYVLDDLNFMA